MKKTSIFAYFLLFLFVSCNPDYFHKNPDVQETYDDENNVMAVNGDEDEKPDNDTTGNNTENNQECIGLSIGMEYFKKEVRSKPLYLADITDEHVGQPQNKDLFVIEFDESVNIKTTHKLGIGSDADPRTCTICVYMDTDIDSYGTYKFYFQKSGYITIDYYDELNKGIKGFLSVKLVETDQVNSSVFEVPGGDCYEVETELDILCEPQCDGKICGDDGCGRTCGECGENEYCSNDQSECIQYECEEISFDEVELVNWDYIAYAKDNAAGDKSIPDKLYMQFYQYKLPVGTFDISPDNESTPFDIYIYLCEDYENDSCKRYYRQKNGIMTIYESSEEKRLESTGSASFTLEEYRFNGDGDAFLPDDRKCYNIKDMTWDTFCKPDCTGKTCGGDGCGGSCGECGGNTMCNAEQTECVPPECTKITSLSVYHSSFISDTLYKEYTYLPNTGEDDENFIDRIFLRFAVSKIEYNYDYDLSKEDETPFSFYIEEDFGLHHDDENDYNYYGYGKYYKIEKGTITIESIDTENTPHTMKAIMKDLRFVEAEKNKDGDLIRVDGGNCIEFSTGKFNDL